MPGFITAEDCNTPVLLALVGMKVFIQHKLTVTIQLVKKKLFL